MKFGYCANVNFLLTGDEQSRVLFDAVLKAGYDYIELPLSAMLRITTEQYVWLKRTLRDAAVPCRANFLLFPHELPLVGSERDLIAICSHARKVLPIAADLGSELVVFGNGGSRRVREGMDGETVKDELTEILIAIDPIAGEYGVRIALEPLCSLETNMVNSFSEAAEMASQAGGHTGAVCDLYHVITDGQSPNEVLINPEKLFHMHIACPKDRTIPQSGDDETPYRALKEAAKAAGYDGRLSIEAAAPGGDVLGLVREGLKTLHRIFA